MAFHKAIKNFLTTGRFSPAELEQTDFGRIYFNLPEISESPRTTEELADTLKKYHKLGRPVTIRNTGHSVNGQTLTSGVEINIGNIKKITFEPQKLQVTAGTGNSWDEVLRGIKFPNYCMPVFPSNPNQQIKIGGSASVGGVGFYSSSREGCGIMSRVSN